MIIVNIVVRELTDTMLYNGADEQKTFTSDKRNP